MEDNKIAQTSMVEEDEISISMLLHVALDRLWLLILCCILGVAAAVGYLYVTPLTYESSVKVLVSPISSASSVEDIISMSTGGSNSNINTEVDLIKSKTNLMNALGLLDLSKYTNPDGIPYSELKFSAKGLQDMVKVTLTSNTRTVSIAVTNTSPEFCADYANAVAQAYTELLESIARNSKTSQKETIESQIPLNEKNLAEAREKLAQFMSENETSQMAVKREILTKQNAFLQMQKEPIALQSEELLASLNALYASLSSYTSYTLDRIQQRSEVKAALSDYSSSLKELMLYESLGTQTDQNRVFTLQASITEKEKAFLSTISSLLGTARDFETQQKVASYAKAVSDYILLSTKAGVMEEVEAYYDSELANFQKVEKQLVQLESDVNIYATLVLKLKEMLEETRILESSVTGNVTIIDPAAVPTNHVAPSKAKTLVIAFMAGFILGYGISFLIEMTDVTIRDEDLIKKILGDRAVSLGWIPYVQEVDKKCKTPNLFVINDNTSYCAERYRILANNIVYSTTEKVKTISIISPDMSEGKTTATVNLAATYALLGKKVLVVDGDFRYSQLEKLFNLKHSRNGICDVLVKNIPMEEVVVRPLEALPNLHLLPQGRGAVNPNMIFGSEGFAALMKRLEEVYDYILIDCPPISYGSDFTLLSQYLDGFILDVRAGVTAKGTLSEFKKTIPFIKAPFLGYLYYGVDPRSEKSYGYSYGGKYGYNGYGYGYGYGYDSDGKKGKKKSRKTKKADYKNIHKRELKNRFNSSSRYGTQEPVLAYGEGSTTAFGDHTEEEIMRSSFRSKKGEDLLAAFENDMAAKGGKRIK